VNWSREFTELDKTVHDRESFDCGETELNEFIQQRAVKHMEASVSITMVLPASTLLSNGKYPICAFFTVAPSSLNKESLPPTQKKNLPNYPVPVFLIAQMAVHSECKRKGLGKITLTKALEYLWDINKCMKAYAVIVDCLNPSVEEFYAKYNFQPLCITQERMRMYIPMKTVEMLFQ